MAEVIFFDTRTFVVGLSESIADELLAPYSFIQEQRVRQLLVEAFVDELGSVVNGLIDENDVKNAIFDGMLAFHCIFSELLDSDLENFKQIFLPATSYTAGAEHMLSDMTVDGILNDDPDNGGQEDPMVAALYALSMLAAGGDESNAKIVFYDILSDFESLMHKFFETYCTK